MPSGASMTGSGGADEDDVRVRDAQEVLPHGAPHGREGLRRQGGVGRLGARVAPAVPVDEELRDPGLALAVAAVERDQATPGLEPALREPEEVADLGVVEVVEDPQGKDL